MKKIILILIFGILLLSIVLVSANGSHESEIEEGKKLVESEISCDKLTDEQLEEIGDYYMEQMHSGEAHEMMDQMMGGEGSDSLKQMHINMAKRIYCDEDTGGMMSGGMMGGMMAGGGMMGNYYPISQNNNYYQNNLIFQIFFYIILTLLIIVLILIIILLINKSKQTRRKTK